MTKHQTLYQNVDVECAAMLFSFIESDIYRVLLGIILSRKHTRRKCICRVCLVAVFRLTALCSSD